MPVSTNQRRSRTRSMKRVCDVLDVARSHLQVRVHRPATWTDRRRQARSRDDGELVAELRHEIATLPSYGYRRAWALVLRGSKAGRRDDLGPCEPLIWCPRPESNRHALRPGILSPMRLPISPLGPC